jgi:hypothetical protein
MRWGEATAAPARLTRIARIDPNPNTLKVYRKLAQGSSNATTLGNSTLLGVSSPYFDGAAARQPP